MLSVSGMALLCDYFLAANDEAAAETIEWVGGPSRPPEVKGGPFREPRPLAL